MVAFRPVLSHVSTLMFFTDAKDFIDSVYEHPLLEEQPKYICDLGSGDGGSLLSLIYDTIQNDTV